MKFPPQLEHLVSIAEKLRGAHLQTRSIDWIREQVSLLIKEYEIFGVSRTAANVRYRARRCKGNQGFSTLQEALYPPQGSPDFGRANFPRSPVLYASWNEVTALDEIAAQVGDYIQIVAARQIPGIVLPYHVVGEIQSIMNSAVSLVNHPPSEKRVEQLFRDGSPALWIGQYIDSFFAELFRKRVAHAYEYKLTAVFAELFHKSNGGLMYPSVETSRSMNMAVSAGVFDANFEVIYTELFRVESCYGYGMYETSPLKYSCDFEPNGVINWDSSKRLTGTFKLQGGLQIDEPFIGWWKPRTETP